MLIAALALCLVCAAILSIRRLGVLHPATLWLAAWAAATTLLTLPALPYVPLSLAAVAIIAAWSAAFCAGTLIGSHRRVTVCFAQRLRRDHSDVALAAALGIALALAGLGSFLVQTAASYGLHAALVSDINVRLAIGAGETPVTIKYIYFAFAAAALAGVAAGSATKTPERRRWLGVAAFAIGMQYFSTGRSNIFLAAVIACMGYLLVAARPLSRRQAIAVGGGIVALALAVFVGMGSLLGKSFDNSDLRTFDNAFVRHDVLRPLALPYQYLTAPLPGFDAVRSVTPATGRGACMTLSPVCAVGAKIGLPVSSEPGLAGFTRPPNSWNTFSALYAPLVDAGPWLGALIMFAEGLLFGLLWGLLRLGWIHALVAYAVMASAVLYSTIEGTLLQPHLVGAAIIAVVLVIVAAHLSPRVSARARHG